MRESVYSNFHTPDAAFWGSHAIYVEREGLVGAVGDDFNRVKR